MERMSHIVGIMKLGEAMKRKKSRWAASVYDRGVAELREVAQKILTENLEEGTELRLPEGRKNKIQSLCVVEAAQSGVYKARSRVDARTAAATSTWAEYLGTAVGAGVLAVDIGQEIGDTAITDSQAAIGRIRNLQSEPAWGWIEERVVRAAGGGHLVG